MVNRLMLAAASPQFCRDLQSPAGSFALGLYWLALFVAQVVLSIILTTVVASMSIRPMQASARVTCLLTCGVPVGDETAMHLFVHLHAYLVKHIDEVSESCH